MLLNISCAIDSELTKIGKKSRCIIAGSFPWLFITLPLGLTHLDPLTGSAHRLSELTMLHADTTDEDMCK
jgi:hypothetical protein